jgi:glucose-6-phosphate 1-dehydrogenase
MRSDEIQRAWEIMDPIIAATERPDPAEVCGRLSGTEVRR